MPAVALGPPAASQGRTVLIMLRTVITLVILTQMAAGLGLYGGMSSAGSLLQAFVRRRERRLAASFG